MKISALLRSLVLLPLFVHASAVPAQTGYTLTKLGVFAPTAFNSAGLIVGDDTSNPEGGLIEYSNGFEVNVRYFADAAGVNDSGTIVGGVYGGGAQPLIISPTGVQTVINPFNLDSPVSGATAVNSAGLMTGYAFTQDNGYEHGFTYDTNNGTLTDLGTLGGNYSVASAINDLGWVTGQARTTAGPDHAYIYANGIMTDLGALPGGQFSQGYGINLSGAITGYSQAADGNNHAVIWANGQMQDLGLLGGTHSYGAAINNNGQVVGYVYYLSTGQQRAFYYDPLVGAMVDLSSMVQSSPLAPYVNFTAATAINDKGWILAYGYNSQDGQSEGFLITPQPVLPTPPSNLKASAGNGTVSLNWAGSTDAGGAPITYTVLEGTSPGAEYFPIWSGTTTSTTLNGLTNGSTYYFVVTAASIGGITARSNEVSATPQSAPAPVVSIHAKPTLIALGASSTLTWASQNATSCTASGAWSGRVALRGTRVVAPTAKGSYTYTLSCTGAGGSTSASTLLRVH